MKKLSVAIGVFLCLVLFFTIHCKSPETSELDLPLIAGKSDSTSGSQTGSGGESSGDATTTLGTLVIKMKDKPVEDADQVWVTISSIKVHYADNDEWFELFNGSFDYDLLVLKYNTATLDMSSLPSGHYNQIRVDVTAGWIIFPEDDEEYDMKIPSGKIKIPLQFQIEAGGMTEIVLDFDAGESIKLVKHGNKDSYKLTPVIKVTNVTYQ